MFDPFEQGDPAVTRTYGGLGLGLAICQGIVRAHGGTIRAASEGRDRGATLTVELPCVEVEERPDSGAVGSESAAKRPALRILLVDDHLDTVKALGRLLRRLDHRVTAAGSVAEALAAADGQVFDVVVSDLVLPDGSGLDLMRRLREAGPIKGVAVTGYGTQDEVDRTMRAGFAAHLAKPIAFDALRQVLEKLAEG
jgi:CheY-like chemotaxis protein